MNKNNMDSKDTLVVFKGQKIRRTWNNKEWWFVLEDIVYILTDSSDPKQYIQKIKRRDENLAKGWVQIVHTLAVDTTGGMQILKSFLFPKNTAHKTRHQTARDPDRKPCV